MGVDVGVVIVVVSAGWPDGVVVVVGVTGVDSLVTVVSFGKVNITVNDSTLLGSFGRSTGK